MKKIAILTHYYHNKNLGGLLQAYALTKVLSDKGYEAKQIPFDISVMPLHAKKQALALRLKKLSCKRIYNYFKGLFAKPCPKAFIKKRDILFENFESSIPHDNNVYNTASVGQAGAKYDIFITGSDQVFASYLLPFNAFYGEFTAPDKKVISYAASSNSKQFMPLDQKLFAEKLARLNFVSVREKTLKNYIESITDKKAAVVLDPTFLLSAQEWLKIANPVAIPQKPYILCYFLGSSAWQRKKAQTYADKYGYKVIHLPYIMKNLRPADRFLKGQGLYEIGPREFIALLSGAECVFTDSFHAAAFCINFGKNFYVFNRNDLSGKKSMNARISDTLETFLLTERHITDKNAALNNNPLDFEKARKILAQEKEKSINWLLKAIKE